jgi:hypothetical protein
MTGTPGVDRAHPLLDVPITEHDGRVLDWRPRYDVRSRAYGMAGGRDQLPATGSVWRPGRTMDQGREGACTGFAAAAELAAEPVAVPRIGNGYALGVYRMAQRLDEWPGENYSGSSVNAAKKVLRSRGYCTGWRWAFSAEQLVAGIVESGPAVIGVEWRSGSYDTDPENVLRPSGSVVGGHALCLLGAIPAGVELSPDAWQTLEDLGLAAGVRTLFSEGEDAVAIGVNSWGPTYGSGGLFVVAMSTLRAWCRAGWEAAQAEGRKRPGRGGTVATNDDQDDQDTATEAQPATAADESTETLELPARELREGDRLFLSDTVGATLERESATVRGLRLARGVASTVLVQTRTGSFPLGADTTVKVRRPASEK